MSPERQREIAERIIGSHVELLRMILDSGAVPESVFAESLSQRYEGNWRRFFEESQRDIRMFDGVSLFVGISLHLEREHGLDPRTDAKALRERARPSRMGRIDFPLTRAKPYVLDEKEDPVLQEIVGISEFYYSAILELVKAGVIDRKYAAHLHYYAEMIESAGMPDDRDLG